jgi:hypothetical protein
MGRDVVPMKYLCLILFAAATVYGKDIGELHQFDNGLICRVAVNGHYTTTTNAVIGSMLPVFGTNSLTGFGGATITNVTGHAAIHCNGSNSYAKGPAITALNGATAWTISAFCVQRADTSSSSDGDIIRISSSTYVYLTGLIVSKTSLRPQFVLFSSGKPSVNLTAPTANPLGAIKHIAGTYDGTTATLYIDGAAAASTNITGYTLSSMNFFTIGSLDGSNPRVFNGDIWDVQVYRRALSAEEIRRIGVLK